MPSQGILVQLSAGGRSVIPLEFLGLMVKVYPADCQSGLLGPLAIRVRWFGDWAFCFSVLSTDRLARAVQMSSVRLIRYVLKATRDFYLHLRRSIISPVFHSLRRGSLGSR